MSNCESYEEYYYLLGLVIKECERVLKQGGKFVIQYEDYNYIIGRDNKMGQESLTGDINKIFLENKFSLWTKAIGLTDDEIQRTIRISLSEEIDIKQIDEVVNKIKNILQLNQENY